MGSADSVDVTTSVTNITADNVTVYVEGDYNPATLYHPKVTELHVVNNTNGALWNPTLAELPTTLHAAVMRDAEVAILYDGWVDLEHTGTIKPHGATRAGEILGYDIYAKLGEQYHPDSAYTYSNGGIYADTDSVNYAWSIVQLYRAVGIEQVELYVTTEEAPEDFDINASPLVQFLSMQTMGPDLSAARSNVIATRTSPDRYLEMAAIDGVSGAASTDPETQTLTCAEFCVLAYTLMDLYGEPVLTDQEMYLLLEAYGSDLPYDLPALQLEAIKYLLARGILDVDIAWAEDITFQVASTILMRIKDVDSRLTFKEIQLTTDVGLLGKDYFPTEVVAAQSPVEIVDQFADYSTYTEYDYFVEAVRPIMFSSDKRFTALPFVGATSDNGGGVKEGTRYMGRVTVDDREFYHFRVEQSLDGLAVQEGGKEFVYINTSVNSDVPAKYQLPAPTVGNGGGYWLYTGTTEEPLTSTSVVANWEWHALDEGGVRFPSEYCDLARKEGAVQVYDTQLGLFNESSYGYTVRIYMSNLGSVKYRSADDSEVLLSTLTAPGSKAEALNGVTITREQTLSKYVYFTFEGCNNKQALSKLLVCDEGTAYQSFPAFSKNNDQFLVPIDYLKALGVVWEFTKTSPNTYYLGVLSQDELTNDVDGKDMRKQYTDVYIGTSGRSAYVIRGTQLTLYPDNRVVIWEEDNSFYVDYEAVLGIQKAVAFSDSEGAVTLSRKSATNFLEYRYIPNVNVDVGTQKVTSEYLATVKVYDKQGTAYTTYVYAPASYVLANWLIVDNKVDFRQSVFSFFASNSPESDSDGARDLRSMLGVETSGTGWQVYSKAIPPLDNTLVTVEGHTLTYTKDGTMPDILYVQALNAYLLKPQYLDADMSYGEWVTSVGSGDLRPITSIVAKFSDASAFTRNGYIADWNYNLYTQTGTSYPGFVVHQGAVQLPDNKVSNRNGLCDMSAWTGDPSIAHESQCFTREGYWSKWVPGAVGVPGLLGYPYSTSYTLASKSSVDTYSGIAYVRRGGKGASLGASVVEGAATSDENNLSYSVIHMTEHKVWLQSCGFAFTFMDESPLSPNMVAPSITGEGAVSGFDWGQFFQDVGLQNADDWLTIAIIAVLNILPRIFMFAFVLLMGLALIADVKPWQLFCDSVFDPYKFLTLGRKDVHTIQLKMVFMYSIIALALFGLFQNGIILEVIAWVARAVTGLLSR